MEIQSITGKDLGTNILHNWRDYRPILVVEEQEKVLYDHGFNYIA